MVVDFRRTRRDHSPLYIDDSTVEIVKSKFLGVHLAHLPPPILTTFYRGTIESILSSCITAWFGNCTASDRKSLQRVVRTAEKIIAVSFPTITDIYTTRCIRKATSIVDDHTHPSHTHSLPTYHLEKGCDHVRPNLSFSSTPQHHPPLTVLSSAESCLCTNMGMGNETQPSGSSKLAAHSEEEDGVVEIIKLEDVEPAGQQRETWTRRLEFVLASVGYAVGLGNVWRFPYLCYRSGGGAFLIPYLIMLFLCGIPLLFMEYAIGQYTRLGPVHGLAKICPLLKGVGLATVVISFVLATYYNVLMTWALYYLFNSFGSNLPWQSCNNTWNAVSNCSTGFPGNATHLQSASQQFFDRKLLEMTDGIEEAGGVRWELFGLLALAWLIIYFCIFKGVKSTGKVVYFTATFPYFMLFALLVNNVQLPGAKDGILFFLMPNWSKLLEVQVWVNAAAQIFNSIGIAFGSMISMASYNKYNNNILRWTVRDDSSSAAAQCSVGHPLVDHQLSQDAAHRTLPTGRCPQDAAHRTLPTGCFCAGKFWDTFVVSLANSATSILAGFVIFSAIGYMAHIHNLPVDDIATDGPGLVFVVYPEAFSTMPVSQLWAPLFFFMLLCLGLDSEFAMVEVAVTCIMDGFGVKVLRVFKRKELLVLAVCSLGFLLGIPHITRGGIYVFQLMDHYTAVVSLMFLAFFEVLAVTLIFGVQRICVMVENMLGKRPNLYFRVCWQFLSPMLVLGILISSIVQYTPARYGKSYTYPVWAEVLGWFISLISIIWIPLGAVHEIYRNKGSLLQRLKVALTPTVDLEPINTLSEKQKVHSESIALFSTSQ
ncbi:hypothetical protein NFI96_013716 [Prochilodus magdalenae]|nr:hypothetical protein NFI96_013716 [Prochilodus magdalenae]